MSRGAGVWRWAGYAFVGVLLVATIVPFLYMISTSLMDELEVMRFPPPLLPERPRFENYPAALTALPFGRFFANAAIVAGVVVVGQVLTSAAAAYAFARLRFPGRERVFLAFLSVLMIPATTVVVPRFLVIQALGWTDSYAGLIATEMVSVWGIFLLRQSFITLPHDLEDAARLDGASEWTIFWHVMLPLSKPALAAVAVFAFAEQWKSLLWPLVATRSIEMRVVEVGLASLPGIYPGNWPYQMAAAVSAMVPLLLVFVVAQRYFVRGLAPAEWQ
ncbi:MAG TPA: carbohydrate ABC transporter permease [Gemmatimonadales bacterium]